jgi:hypothetical protein
MLHATAPCAAAGRFKEANVSPVSNTDPRADTNRVSRGTSKDRQARHPEPSPAEVAHEAAAMYPDTFVTPPSADEIAAEAYAIYIARGGDHGRDQDDWLEAERRLKGRHR